jgi:hypothetical protein
MHTNGAVVAGCSARVHGGCEIFTKTLRLTGWGTRRGSIGCSVDYKSS